MNGRISVVSLHPAIDRVIVAPGFHREEVVRGRELPVEPAGKGINVARTLVGLGHSVAGLGFLAERDAPRFNALFPRGHFKSRFVLTPGPTRENLTLVDYDAHRETHVLVGAMHVSKTDVAALGKAIEAELKPENWIVFSGSMPSGMGLTDFDRLLRTCRRKGGRICVDAGAPMLRVALRHKLWVIKPNVDELSDFFDRPLGVRNSQLRAARGFLDHCENVLLSLGGEGALLVTTSGAWRAWDPRKVRQIHTVGCGDTLLAGFIAASADGKTPPDALRFAVACGSACVRTPSPAITSPAPVQKLLRGVHIEAIKTSAANY